MFWEPLPFDHTPRGPFIGDAPAALRLFEDADWHPARETLLAAHLDGCRRLVRMTRRVSDTPDAITLCIRTMVGDCARYDTEALILAHNHPSGNPLPSRADIDATRRLAQLLRAMGITLDDHLIFAGDRHVSMRAMALI